MSRTSSSYLPRLSRRDWLKLSAAGVVGFSMSGWLERLAADTANDPRRRRGCILLWMNGGPSQMDTFDLKPGHANGGPYTEIDTSVPGIKIGQHLPKIAKHMDHMAIVRSMSTKEGDHVRATFYLRTGYMPGTPIQFPALGASIGKELCDESSELPSFVSIAPYRFDNSSAFGSGFLGPQYAPLVVGDANIQFQQNVDYNKALKVQDLLPPREVAQDEVESRINLLQGLERDFVASHGGVSSHSHQSAYERAVRLMRTQAAKAFELDEEPASLRDSYGRNLFGQGCLLARRLVERGVPFVEVTLGAIPQVPEGWDTHQRNFDQVAKLCAVLDGAWATLMDDLKQRGLLDTTLVVWMGEFGRTPKINPEKGRDHFPNAWSTVLGGGGIKGGQVVGKTTPDGMKVAERSVAVPDFLATICHALGVDPMKQNPSNVGRPIRIADPTAKPIKEVLA
jgi:Protein of unknown function (DUF1501)